MKNSIIITVLLILVIGGVAFFAGMKYQQNKPSAYGMRQFGGNGGQGRMGFGGGNRMGFRPVSGDIVASDDKSITVKLADGSSRIILVSTNTVINKAEKAAVSDLKVGEKVAVFGQENSDGSVTAQNIQLNPQLRGQQRINIPPAQ